MADAKLIALVEANTKQFENALKRLEALGVTSFRKQEQSVRRFEASVSRAGNSVRTMEAGFARLSRVAEGVGAAFSVRAIADYADTWTRAGNQMRAAAQISGKVVRPLEEINDIAQETRSGLDETVRLYGRLIQASQGLAVSEQEIASITRTVNEAFKAGGRSTSEQIAGILQLTQAIGSGLLQGDELRSLREAAPLLAQAIANEFQTTIGGLKQLGSEGQLTADRIIRAIQKGGPEIHAAFAVTVPTLADSMTLLNNAFIQFVGTLNEMGNVTPRAVAALADLSKWVRENAQQFDTSSHTINFLTEQTTKALAATVKMYAQPIINHLEVERVKKLTEDIKNLNERIIENKKLLQKEAVRLGMPTTNPMVSAALPPDMSATRNQVRADQVALLKAEKDLEIAKGQILSRQVNLVEDQRAARDEELNVIDKWNSVAQALESANHHLKETADVFHASAKEMETAMAKQGDFATSLAQVPEKLRQSILDAATEFDVAPNLLASMLQVESHFQQLNPKTGDILTSPAGAQGIAQFIPGTARKYGVNVYDIDSSIRGMAHLMHDLLIAFNGDTEAAVAAYNAGETRVKKFLAGQGALPAETQAYVPQVMKGVPTYGEQLTTTQQAAEDAKTKADDIAKSKEAIITSINREIEALGLEARAFGQSTFEAEKAKEFQDLLNQATDAGIPITAAYTKQLEDLAAKRANAVVGVELASKANDGFTNSQQSTIDKMDEVRDFSQGVLSGFISDMAHGKTAAEALAGALEKIADQLIDIASQSIIDSIFRPQGAAGGILESVFKPSTFSLAAAPLAKGGIMTSHGPVPLKRYQGGGIASSPQMAMFGEGSQPEAYVPLPDGRRIPVSIKAPSISSMKSGGGGGWDVHNRVSVDPSPLFYAAVESRVQQMKSQTLSETPRYLQDRNARLSGRR